MSNSPSQQMAAIWDEPVDLTIPEFLQRKPKGNHMRAEDTQAATGKPLHEEAPAQEITIDMLMEQIKRLSAKRDEIQATLSGLKKQLQKMVGKL